ncbi:MAG: nitroreductase family protein [bacterium]|nr:nitroreductase family protein [bacterium]
MSEGFHTGRMTCGDVMQAIKKRRSIRKYKPDDIADNLLNELLEAARWAPSWANTQCWEFIVVRDKSVKERLVTTLSERNPARPGIVEAPVVLVACAELKKAGFYKGEPRTDKGDWFMFDVALALQNLTLAAYSYGLGTVHVGAFDAKEAAKILGVPDGIAVVELMPVGYPAEYPEPPLRKELSTFVYKDRYGKSA